MERLRVLIADDDRSWIYRLESILYCRSLYVDNLSDALRIIDEESRIDAGIFDRVLSGTGERINKLSFPVPHMNAGFVLSIAFHKKFPGSRTVVCSGAPPDSFHSEGQFQRIVDDELCRFISKYNSDWANEVISFLRERPPSSQFKDSFLDKLLLEPNIFGLGINLRSIIDGLVSFSRRRRQNKSMESDCE